MVREPKRRTTGQSGCLHAAWLVAGRIFPIRFPKISVSHDAD